MRSVDGRSAVLYPGGFARGSDDGQIISPHREPYRLGAVEDYDIALRRELDHMAYSHPGPAVIVGEEEGVCGEIKHPFGSGGSGRPIRSSVKLDETLVHPVLAAF